MSVLDNNLNSNSSAGAMDTISEENGEGKFEHLKNSLIIS